MVEQTFLLLIGCVTLGGSLVLSGLYFGFPWINRSAPGARKEGASYWLESSKMQMGLQVCQLIQCHQNGILK